ncbi:MAG: helix-turn-helix domain-containing protein, partial [Clostridia bacterium]|nr:helix-turn-helix domain-containing protein [Clostridia bacterium]
MAKGKYQEWLEPDGLLKLEGWARDGLNDEQIAKNMGINVATLYKYKNLYSKINEALKRGKEVIDIEVENALYKRAIGYTYEEVKEEEMPDG